LGRLLKRRPSSAQIFPIKKSRRANGGGKHYHRENKNKSDRFHPHILIIRSAWDKIK